MKKDHLLLGLFCGCLIAAWSLGLMKVAVSSLPYNPVSLSKKERINMSVLLPQGWAFFTKDPRESYVAIYEEKEGSLELAIKANASSYNLFGAKRLTRAMGIEVGALAGQIKARQWTDCYKSVEECYRTADLPELTVVNKAHSPNYCGSYFLSLEEPVPWAWAKSYDEVEMPSKIIKINVLCL